MRDILSYKNKLWKKHIRFTTAGIHDFTLQPGKYLLLCRGARGGSANIYSGHRNIGGTAIGVLNLSAAENFHAYVGGNGGDAPVVDRSVDQPGGAGGFNGGGDGGLNSAWTSYQTAAGGGGASDIRLKTPIECVNPDEQKYIPTLPDGYTQVEYLESDGTQYFDTGYIAKDYTTFTVSASYDHNYDQAILGTQLANADGPGWVCWLSPTTSNSKIPAGPKFASLYGERFNSDRNKSFLTNVPPGTKATYRCDKLGTYVNDQVLYFDHETETAYGPDPDHTILFLTARRGDDPTIGGRMFRGRVYFFRIYELINDQYTLVHQFIPCERDADHVLGLYDTVDHQFITPTKTSSTDLTSGGTGRFDMDNIELPHRGRYPTIPEGYTQIEYVQSAGGFFESGYVATRLADSTFTFRAKTGTDSRDTAIFGSQSSTNTNPAWIVWFNNWGYHVSGLSDIGTIYGQTSYSDSYMKCTYVCREISACYRVERVKSSVNLTELWTGDPSGEPDSRQIIILNCYRGSSTVSDGSFLGKLYHFCIYEKEMIDGKLTYVLKHEFVPCKRDSDDAIGLLDTMAEDGSQYQFLEPVGGGMNGGPEGRYPIVENDLNYEPEQDKTEIYKQRSLNTRIIVAGGGGGATNYNSGSPNKNHYSGYFGIGGGAVGGCSTAYYSSGAHSLAYASQTSGYAFGDGMPGSPNDGNATPSSGAGGGWYGGYTTIKSDDSTPSGAPGGGSGYVLTADSYKPSGYMPNYQTYVMTDPFLSGGSAEQSEVCVYEEYDMLRASDIVEVIQTGQPETITVPAGTIRLKCWGGDGGVFESPLKVARGGYSEGTLTLNAPATLYAYVGGSGLYSNLISQSYCFQLNPTLGFNGGGKPNRYGVKDGTSSIPGGGSTDIRINDNSVYSRIIVAGGAGGQSAGTYEQYMYMGGDGGGESGEIGETGNGAYGRHPGPGTQTGSPIEPACAECNGGFGYGGSTPTTSDVRGPAGAGGSGWYGGSSTYNTNSSYPYCRGGSGGSGYVLTENSYKPSGYLPDSRFYLSNASTVQGGNTLPMGVSKIEIEVLTAKLVRILCRDMYGLKYFNGESWVLLDTDEITPEVFTEYGSIDFQSDNGLANQYDIIAYDPSQSLSEIRMNIVPNKQTVTHELMTNMKINQSKQKLSFDPTVFDMNITARRRVMDNGNAKITTTIEIDKRQKSNKLAKVFYITYTDGK